MNVSNLLSDEPVQSTPRRTQPGPDGFAQDHGNNKMQEFANEHAHTHTMTPLDNIGTMGHPVAPNPTISPAPQQVKNVRFELLVNPSQQQRARLPMRIGIARHDALADISETVKNFYGLYDGGMSFEDRNGSLLIPTYGNVEDQMLIYVRYHQEDVESNHGNRTPRVSSRTSRLSMSPRKLQPPFQMLPQGIYGNSLSRPSSRTEKARSKSPQSNRGRRSESIMTNPKLKNRPGMRMRGSFDQGGNASDSEGMDGVEGSVASSRRSKADVVASAEISVENIVEGGRRKRAKFDSSELPLFVPPQVPNAASLSSASPQRRVGSQPVASPYAYNHQQTFSYMQPLPSPQSNGYVGPGYTPQPYSSNRNLRARPPVQYVPTRASVSGILPTPDPTIGGSMSVISDEDVALQLMRLGDISNFSSHGRTSTSTLDDAFSGKAEAPSSDEESDHEGHDHSLPSIPLAANGNGTRVYEGESSGEDYEDQGDGSFKGESDPILPDEQGFIRPKPKKPRLDTSVASKSTAKISKTPKSRNPSTKPKSKSVSSVKGVPISPASLPPHSRKTSNASLNSQYVTMGPDEEDLSARPRCQRCRKSKKGCDRQRPCGRCRDAGIGIEGCISEDEGNGRKGRYGRHMGVVIKKDGTEALSATTPMSATPEVPSYMPAPIGLGDKSKKRKRSSTDRVVTHPSDATHIHA